MSGPIEEVKGVVKQKAGEITDNPDLRREGAAQRDKGEAETEAAKGNITTPPPEGRMQAAE